MGLIFSYNILNLFFPCQITFVIPSLLWIAFLVNFSWTVSFNNFIFWFGVAFLMIFKSFWAHYHRFSLWNLWYIQPFLISRRLERGRSMECCMGPNYPIHPIPYCIGTGFILVQYLVLYRYSIHYLVPCWHWHLICHLIPYLIIYWYCNRMVPAWGLVLRLNLEEIF